MPTTVRKYDLEELGHPESKNQILLDTQIGTELNIVAKNDGSTEISFPFGNKFDIIDGRVIIYEVNLKRK